MVVVVGVVVVVVVVFVIVVIVVVVSVAALEERALMCDVPGHNDMAMQRQSLRLI